METAIEQRAKIAPDRFFDLYFHDVVADPVAAVERMYAHFGFDLGETARIDMVRWITDNPQGRHGGHHYTPEAFGLSEEAMTERFGRYLDHFGVEREKAG
jgi:hypothetical protein